MAFQITPNVSVTRDSSGVVRQLSHLQQPFLAAGLAVANPRALSRNYLQEVASVYSIESVLLSTLDQSVGETLTADGNELRFGSQSSLLETTVVAYSQTRWSLPIWEAGLGVSILGGPQRVTSSRSTLHINPIFHEPSKAPKYLPRNINESVLARLLGLKAGKTIINGTRLRVYQYDPGNRYDPESSQSARQKEAKRTQSLLHGGPPVLPLPAVPAAIKAFLLC